MILIRAIPFCQVSKQGNAAKGMLSSELAAGNMIRAKQGKREITPYVPPRKIPILSRLRRFDRIALAGKSPCGLEGLFPGHPPRDRAPAGIVVEGELPDDRPVF